MNDWEKCPVCRQRITDSDWVPFCCEVCYDSAAAADRELGERMHRDGFLRRTERLQELQAANDRRLADQAVSPQELSNLIGKAYKGMR